jgi:predicted DNA-binding transcriptional regulator YafY
MRLDRLLAITVLLLNRRKVTAKELAEYFEVSVRTIYRDIDAINMAGIPIISYSGNTGGYGIMENFKLDRQFLTMDDLQKILSALKGLNKAFADNKIGTAIEKITSLVPRDKSEELQFSLDKMIIDVVPWGYGKQDNEKLKTIQHAVSESRLLRILYHSGKGEIIERTIEPMSLIFKGVAWYLFAFCQVRNDFRLFKITRIQSIDILDEKFVRKNKQIDDLNNWKERKTVTIKLQYAQTYHPLMSEYFEEEQCQTQPDGSIIAEMTIPEDEWITSFILGLGDRVKVLSPPHIQEKVITQAKGILEHYQ